MLENISRYFTYLFNIFGINDVIGIDNEEKNAEKIITPILDEFALFRDDVRKMCKEKKSNFYFNIDSNEIFKLCDKLRDEILPKIGVHLEDTKSNSIWKWKNCKK
jgi:cysteinyl-tRNA synthetase